MFIRDSALRRRLIDLRLANTTSLLSSRTWAESVRDELYFAIWNQAVLRQLRPAGGGEAGAETVQDPFASFDFDRDGLTTGEIRGLVARLDTAAKKARRPKRRNRPTRRRFPTSARSNENKPRDRQNKTSAYNDFWRYSICRRLPTF